MVKTGNNTGRTPGRTGGQAAIELAVFGAVLVFILGAIIRTAVSNGYTQNENFKAMRLAMLASWQYSKQSIGKGSYANISHNTSSALFIEDRLSPDVSKYGDLDRDPYISQGAGTFSYELEYPGVPGADATINLTPVEDVWVNGVHFPFSTAAFVVGRTIEKPGTCTSPAGSCQQNQCLRNQREWVGGTVTPSLFQTVIPAATLDSTTNATLAANGLAIFNELVNEGVITPVTGPSSQVATVNFTTVSPNFVSWLSTNFGGDGQAEANQVDLILQNNRAAYKLFFTEVPNGATTAPLFTATPPASCSGVNNALCATAELPPSTMCPAGDTDTATGACINTDGYMQYDLKRNGDYVSVETQFPTSGGLGAGTLRNEIEWQWAATPALNAGTIGLDPSNNQYPQYDVDGRLKEVTIYDIGQAPDGAPTVTYEDYQGGDLDNSWDSNSCGPKPGLLNNAEVFTFTKQGTYLKVKEGKLYNPETDQYVRSVNQRDTIDIIQREIQLSNNTGRFCDASGNLVSVVEPCLDGSTCQSNGSFNDGQCSSGNGTCVFNPIEVCVVNSGDSCFSAANIARTCYDENSNLVFVRSRLEDRRGHFWMTDTTGQMNVH